MRHFESIALIILIFLGLTVRVRGTTTLQPRTEQIHGYPPRTFHINLDLPPKERWAGVVAFFKPHMQEFQQHMQNISHVPKSLFKVSRYVLSAIHAIHGQEYVEDMRAIAELAEVDFNFLYTMNFVLEKKFQGLSLIARTKYGKIVHGYNLDSWIQKLVADLSAHAIFYQKGRVVYEATIIAGSPGFPSGLKPGKFAISMSSAPGEKIWSSFKEFLFHNSTQAFYLTRKVLETAENFTQAVDMLSNIRLMYPVYYTVSGVKPNEGVIISRSSSGFKEKKWIGEGNSSWFLVQASDPKSGKKQTDDLRKISAERNLKNIDRRIIGEIALMDNVFGVFPNLNAKTIQTVIFSPEISYFNTTLWY